MSQQYYMPEPKHYYPPPTSPSSIHPYTHTNPEKTSNYNNNSNETPSNYYNNNERPLNYYNNDYNHNERPPYESQNTSYMPPQNGYPPPPSFEQAMNSGSDNSKFNTRTKYQDLWAVILFTLDLLAFIAVSAISLRNYAIIQRQNRTSVENVTLNWSTIWILMFCAGIGLALSTGYLILAHKFPKQFIKVTFFLSIVMYWCFTVYFFIVKYFSLAILFAIVAIFYTLYWFWWKPLIPFSSVMLRTITSIMNRYKAMILTAFVGLFVHILYTIWWIFTLIAAYQVWYPAACKQAKTTSTNCQTGQFTVIVIFLLFTYYWVSQVIQTFIHVTTSGVFASYYFLEGTPQGVPPSPTLGSAKRAATTSFGSICFGSLLVAILQVIRQLLRSLAQDVDNPLGAFCAACAAVIVGYIDALLEYFNFYAYTQVAIYGKSFCDAVKDTWTMIQDRGIEAVINDNLIGSVVTMGSFLVGMVTALFGYLYTIIFHPSFNDGGGFTPLIVFLAFIIGFQMLSIIGSVIFSGAATTFVCLAEDPDALARTKPDLYNEVVRTYPGFAQGIRA
ncbi:plasma-membrane choline transporter-domain-containing protein [Gigaspora rosea]|uniref:Protein PNS1 n=1 Tax=Gigaspora rosea TaxID=44941 RepID=A0A397VG91_9GLOM|nr:plasma-membrane choline transporter-domain-containing protein [Gigaspora rosea]